MVYVRTADDNDALAWVDEAGRTVTESQHEILRAAACEPDTPALARLANHHELVRTGVELVAAEQRSEGGARGRPSSARRRVYERMKDHAESMRDTLFDIKPLHRAIEAIFSRPLQEAARELSQYLRHTELDPERLARTGARVEALHGAGRKYRVAAGDLPAELARLRARLAELQLSADIEALEGEAAAAREAYLKPAGALSVKRARAAKILGAQVTAAMQDLALAGGRFEVALHALDEGAAHGLERVEFLIAGHAGVEPRPLARVASGGELSRMGLAIQVIASRAARVPTLIFDEVDAGIGGAVAETVGKMLKALGAERQVLCVTHLAQVASQGDAHWRVAKRAADGSVLSTVAVLGKAERVEEVARMLGGAEITPTTRKAAREMLAA